MPIFNAKSENHHPYQAKRLFFFRRYRPKASEIDPREALELNLGQNFHHDDEMLMFSAGVDVDESALPRRKHYHCKSAFGATPVDRSGPSARLDFAPDRLASTWIAFFLFLLYCIRCLLSSDLVFSYKFQRFHSKMKGKLKLLS